MRCLLLLCSLFLLPALAVAAPCEGVGLPPRYQALVDATKAIADDRFDDALLKLEEAKGLPDGPAARRRSLLVGRAHLGLTNTAAAQTALEQALEGKPSTPGYSPTPCDADPGEVRWWLGSLEVQRGTPHEAVATWQTIWTDNPTSPWAKQALDGLTNQKAAPDAETEHGRRLIAARAATLTSLNQHKEALKLLDQLPQDESDAGIRTKATACMKAREYQRAADLYASLAKPGAGDRFSQALSISRLGRYDEAASVYQDLIAQHPGTAEAGQASFKLGYLAWDSGDREHALARFREHREKYPTSRHDDEALWYQAWTLMRLHRLPDAAAAMEELAGKSSSLAAGGAYWAARIAGMQSGPLAEEDGLRQVLEAHPDSIYAWWAARRLGTKFEPGPAVTMPNPQELADNLSEEQAGALGRGLTLAGAGIDDWAAAELAPLRSAAKKSRSTALGLAQALADAGAWHHSRRLAMPWCKELGEGRDEVALRLCWPRPGGQAVRDAAAEAGLPPLLPFAIMRAESAFDARIVSVAGARGLMQLMPSLVDVPPDALFDPATNVRLGVEELGSLRASLESTGIKPLEPLIIAGYNGGEEAVRRWLKDQPTPLDVDRWAEEISYSETRRYVRRVLGTLQVYRMVYGD